MRRMYSKPQLLEAVESESKVNGIKVFEDIKDKNGHLRFIEGEIPYTETEGVELVYGKWALSGSHLLFVVCLNGTNGTAISGGVKSIIDLPQWIKDKIYPIYSVEVAQATYYWFGTGGTTQTMTCYLEKKPDDTIQIYYSALTLNADRNVRIAFDLLIDNE